VGFSFDLCEHSVLREAFSGGEGFLGVFGECEQSFLSIKGLLFISLTHVKETNQRKRA
jgi:hypothetical protein